MTDETDADPEFVLRPEEAADVLGVDIKTLANWAHAGKLGVRYTVGGHRRYIKSDVERLARAQGLKAKEEGGNPA